MPAAAAAATVALINTAWPFGCQCLAFHNEFPSGAPNLNVSQRQFELARDDVWADKRTACLCSFFFFFFLYDDGQQNKQTERAGYKGPGWSGLSRVHRFCAETNILNML